jgi:hypothetical protein
MVVAYLDPGAGSLVVQAILASLLALPFFLRTRLAALVGRIRGYRSDSDDSDLR